VRHPGTPTYRSRAPSDARRCLPQGANGSVPGGDGLPAEMHPAGGAAAAAGARRRRGARGARHQLRRARRAQGGHVQRGPGWRHGQAGGGVAPAPAAGAAGAAAAAAAAAGAASGRGTGISSRGSCASSIDSNTQHSRSRRSDAGSSSGSDAGSHRSDAGSSSGSDAGSHRSDAGSSSGSGSDAGSSSDAGGSSTSIRCRRCRRRARGCAAGAVARRLLGHLPDREEPEQGHQGVARVPPVAGRGQGGALALLARSSSAGPALPRLGSARQLQQHADAAVAAAAAAAAHRRRCTCSTTTPPGPWRPGARRRRGAAAAPAPPRTRRAGPALLTARARRPRPAAPGCTCNTPCTPAPLRPCTPAGSRTSCSRALWSTSTLWARRATTPTTWAPLPRARLACAPPCPCARAPPAPARPRRAGWLTPRRRRAARLPQATTKQYWAYNQCIQRFAKSHRWGGGAPSAARAAAARPARRPRTHSCPVRRHRAHRQLPAPSPRAGGWRSSTRTSSSCCTTRRTRRTSTASCASTSSTARWRSTGCCWAAAATSSAPPAAA
jgi:hypothetical protein